MTTLDNYATLLLDVKSRVHGAQTRAALSANRELLRLYWDIGRLIAERQQQQGWGAGVIPRLAADLERDLPAGIKGFSERNLKRMVQYQQAYQDLLRPTETALHSAVPIGPQPVAQLSGFVADAKFPWGGRGNFPADQMGSLFSGVDTAAALSLQLPWGHNILLLEKVADVHQRAWYMRACIDHGHSRDALAAMIKSDAFARHGSAVTNFATTLPPAQSLLAQQTLKDPYVFDFLTLSDGFRERELELGLLAHVEKFLVELGVGFAFVGRQRRLSLGDQDYVLDLLFYHLRLRCFVVVELKVGAFTPEHAGKMNFYLNLVDDTLRHADDQPSIGLILCQEKDRLVAEYFFASRASRRRQTPKRVSLRRSYALRGLDKPIGVSEYELTRALPASLSSSLPTIADLEAELSPVVASDHKDHP